MNIKSSDLELVESLEKWRIQGIQSLLEDSSYPNSYVSFCKKLLRLEKFGFIKKYLDKFSGKKYVFLTSVGKKHLAQSENYECIAEGHERHDLIAVSILRFFEKFSGVEACLVEHEIKADQKYRAKNQLIPDGMLQVKTLSLESKTIAIEVEITRKSKDRIAKKYKQYLECKDIDIAFWFFSSPSVMKSYMKHFEFLHTDKINKFVYILIDEIRLEKLNDMKISYLGNEKNLQDFKGLLGEKTV